MALDNFVVGVAYHLLEQSGRTLSEDEAVQKAQGYDRNLAGNKGFKAIALEILNEEN